MQSQSPLSSRTRKVPGLSEGTPAALLHVRERLGGEEGHQEMRVGGQQGLSQPQDWQEEVAFTSEMY